MVAAAAYTDQLVIVTVFLFAKIQTNKKTVRISASTCGKMEFATSNYNENNNENINIISVFLEFVGHPTDGRNGGRRDEFLFKHIKQVIWCEIQSTRKVSRVLIAWTLC